MIKFIDGPDHHLESNNFFKSIFYHYCTCMPYWRYLDRGGGLPSLSASLVILDTQM